MPNKPVLFVACTHGDEPIGKATIEDIMRHEGENSRFDFVIANPKALAAQKRFVEVDLNRSAPGNADSSLYEERRAFELQKLFQKYPYVIDLHQTQANDRIVVIISKLTREALALALSFDIEEILIWPSGSLNTVGGPLMQYKDYGIEIESGTKTSFDVTRKKLKEILLKFLSDGINRVHPDFSSESCEMKKRKFYLVYERINPEEVEGVELEDFKEIQIQKERFIVLCFGRTQGLKGYKMRQVDEAWIHKNFV